MYRPVVPSVGSTDADAVGGSAGGAPADPADVEARGFFRLAMALFPPRDKETDLEGMFLEF
jgi:hypothetical protein